MIGRWPERAWVAGVGAIVVAAPLLIGGVLPWAAVGMSLACMVLLASTCWVLWRADRGVKLSPLSGALLLACLVTAVQLLPLPVFLARWLSPEAVGLREDAVGKIGLLPLTLDVPATLVELAKVLGLLGLFTAVSAVAHRRRRAVPVLAMVLATGVLVALIGIVQRALETDRILGLYQAASPAFMGTFVNPHHAASLFGLSLCIGIGLAGYQNRGRNWALAGTAIVAVGLAVSLSRGGLIAFGAVTFVLLSMVFSRNFGRITGIIPALVLVAGGVAASLLLVEGMSQRFATVDLQYVLTYQKTRAWVDTLPLIRAFFWTGVGRGAFMAPFQRFRSVNDGTTVTHPENLELQLFSEWGVPLTLLVVGGLGVVLWRHRQRMRNLGPIEWGAAFGILGVVLHNQVDFGLEMPGVAIPTVAVLGVLVARAFAKVGAQRRRLGPWLLGGLGVAWLVVLGLCVWAVPRSLRADDLRLTRLLESKAPLAVFDAEAKAAISRHPADFHLELLTAIAHVRAGDAAAMRHINRVLRLRPDEAQAHRLAAIMLARGRRPAQAALEYRTAFSHGLSGKPAQLREVIDSLGLRTVDAVPQEPVWLGPLATEAARTHPEVAFAAYARAGEVAPTEEWIPLAALRLAIGLRDTPRMAELAGVLEKVATSPEGRLAAAEGFRGAGREPDRLRVLGESLKRFPDSTSIWMAWVQQYLDAGDLKSARVELDRLERAPSLETRHRAAELRAVVETRAGDSMAATSARMRARMYAKAITESSQQEPQQ